MTYSDKLKDPRWQKKRLELFDRDHWSCQLCDSTISTLTIHHKRYIETTEPWDYPDDLLITLCENCHDLYSRAKKRQEDNLAHPYKGLNIEVYRV